MKFSKYEITLPENPTVDELRAAAKQARQYAEERQGQVDMWNNYAGVLERRAKEMELPCGCATPCNTCQSELARHGLPPLP